MANNKDEGISCRTPRTINKEEKDFIFSLKPDDVDRKLLIELFCDTVKKKRKFNTNDKFYLPENKLYNKIGLNTTVGKYLFNLFILAKDETLIKLVGYKNEAMTQKSIDKLQEEIGMLIQEEKLTVFDNFYPFLDRLQGMSYTLSRYLDSSLTYNMLVPSAEIDKKKEELLEKYKKGIEAGNLPDINKYEKELLEFAKQDVESKNIGAYDIYASGGRGSFENNYKNVSLSRGPMKSLRPGEPFHFSKANLLDGIPPEELNYYADLAGASAYSTAVGTREGGAEGKKMSAAFSLIASGPINSDCKTKLPVKVLLTKENYDKYYLWRYIVDKNGNLVLLTPENKDKYIGKYVNMRSPLTCNDKKGFCNKCLGELFYKLQLAGKNGDDYDYGIGIISNRVASRILNSALKLKHNMTIQTIKINIFDYIEEVV